VRLELLFDGVVDLLVEFAVFELPDGEGDPEDAGGVVGAGPPFGGDRDGPVAVDAEAGTELDPGPREVDIVVLLLCLDSRFSGRMHGPKPTNTHGAGG
jgi:hypothetical protein